MPGPSSGRTSRPWGAVVSRPQGEGVRSLDLPAATAALALYTWIGLPCTLAGAGLVFLNASVASGSVRCKAGLWASLALLGTWISWVLERLF